MPATYLVLNLVLVLFFVRNYHGVQKKVSARLFLVIFVLAFILSVVFPNQITLIGSFFGFGRGADFIFSNFVIFSLGAFGLLYKKILHLERRLIELNRQVSIRESCAQIDGK